MFKGTNASAGIGIGKAAIIKENELVIRPEKVIDGAAEVERFKGCLLYTSMGRGAIVIGLAAVIIGEAIFGKIFHNFALLLFSVSLGSIVYYLVLQVVIWMGIDTDLLKLLSAVVVAIFLAIPVWKARYFTKPVKKGGKN